MIEDQLPDRFRAALSDEPPLGFDPDEVVDRAARLHQRRATVIAASAAAATVALAAVTALQVVRADDGEVAGFGSAATSEPTKPSCGPKPTGTKPKPTGTKPIESTPLPTESEPWPSESTPWPSESEPPSESTPLPSESTPWPSETSPSEPESTETKPTATKPKDPRPTGTKPVPTPKPTPTKPIDPCATKPKEAEAFPGWELAVANIEKVGPMVLAAHLPGVEFEPLGVKSYPDVRCVAGFYMVTPDKERGVSLTVCHDEKIGLDGSALAGGHWGAPLSDTTGADGSHVRVYRFDKGENQGGLAVLHQRPDGVVVQADTGAKVDKIDPADVTQEQLTAIATDGRLTF